MEPTIPSRTLGAPERRTISHGASQIRVDGEERRRLWHARECTTVPHALRLQALCRYEPTLLPRYHPDDRGWQNRSRGYHQLAEPGAYSSIETWLSRSDWLDVVVPLVCTLGRDVLRKHSVGLDFMLRWAAVKSAYAHQRTGRRCIVRPKVLAGALLCEERQVQRANAAARELGLEVVVVRGRMLTYEESTECRRRGSTQRGLSSEVAFTAPPSTRAVLVDARRSNHGADVAASVDSDTPTRGVGSNQKSHLKRTHPCASGAKTDGAPRRLIDHEGGPSPALRLARDLTRLLPWLRGESPRRMLGAVAPFAHAALAWTADDLRLAIGAQASRNDGTAHITPGRARVPWALLRHVLAQIDVYADHPRLPELESAAWERAAATARCNHPGCDGHGWHNAADGAQRCPAASPRSGRVDD